ncbi:hypothetical protein SAY86_010524 [Trapa natans]|uniref:gibberellin 2beta-dioxygenase n=1 Tax=Trapa natans TaxID=22666 RepID=A0AAN7R4A1_TRANT|nr:hypothetical protein SAY86_010524 [Trapa natans]
MVVSSTEPALARYSLIENCPCQAPTGIEIPAVDLAAAAGEGRDEVMRILVRACKELGFFKVVNHGVRKQLMERLDAQAGRFFALPQTEKDKAGPLDPMGYGSKMIGRNGDFGWIEYLLLSTSPNVVSENSRTTFSVSPDGQSFRTTAEEYMRAVKGVACEVLELIAEGLKIKPRDALSSIIRDDKSDSLFRINHYPPLPPEFQLQLQPLKCGHNRKLLGFGEHTDPQLISVLRSNDITGLQVCLQDGVTWVSVPPDPFSFFINVGDSLQVLTNGRFKSVKHRVFTDPMKSRVSMIYFGGPAMNQKIAAMEGLMEEGEQSLYKEFTWSEYKKSAYKSRLGDNRLAFFEKSAAGQ